MASLQSNLPIIRVVNTAIAAITQELVKAGAHFLTRDPPTSQENNDIQELESLLGVQESSAALHASRLGKLPVEDLLSLARTYGTDWRLIWEAFRSYDGKCFVTDFTHEPHLRPYLLRIVAALESPPELNLRFLAFPENEQTKFTLFLKNPLAYTQLIERYGWSAIPLLEKRGESAFQMDDGDRAFFDEIYWLAGSRRYQAFVSILSPDTDSQELRQSHEILLTLATILRENTFAFLSALGTGILTAAPNRLAEIAALLGRNAWYLVQALGDDIAKVSVGDLSELVSIYRCAVRHGGTVPGALHHLNYTFLLSRSDEFHELYDRYGDGTNGIFKFLGITAFELREEQRKELDLIAATLTAQDKADAIRISFENIDPEIFNAHPGFYGELTKILGANAPRAFSAIRETPEAIKDDPAFLLAVAPIVHYFTDRFIGSLPTGLTRAEKELLTTVVKANPQYAREFLRTLRSGQLTDNRELILEGLAKYGADFPVLWDYCRGLDYAQFELENRSGIEAVRRLTPCGAQEIFDSVPSVLWNDPKLHRAIAFYEEATGKEYSARYDHLFENELLEREGILSRCKEEFGIRNFRRLIGLRKNGHEDLSLLERNIRHLEVGHTLGRPFFVHILPFADWNDAFINRPKITEEVKEHYTIFYVESGSIEETSLLLRKIACLRGVDVDGDPLFPIEHITFSHHGLPHSIHPGYANQLERTLAGNVRLKPSSTHYSMFHSEVFEEWGKLIAQGGTIVLDCCLTGFLGELYDNFATRMKRAIPHAIVYGSRECSGVAEYRLDENHRICAVKFRDPLERTVRLEDVNVIEELEIAA